MYIGESGTSDGTANENENKPWRNKKIIKSMSNEATDVMKRSGWGVWVPGHDVEVWMTGTGSDLQETE